MYEAKAIDILPGIFMESSDYAAQGRYVDGDNVRFWKGYPERIGGNEQIADARTLAPARGMFAYRSLANTQYIVAGHARGVDLIQGGNVYNITPQGSNGYTTLTLVTGSVTSGPFTTGEEVTTSNGAQGYLYEASAASPIYVTGDNGTLELALTGISGSFLQGEVITATGGGTAIVHTGGSSTPIQAIRESGTFTGTLTGAVSGATATISSATTLWTGTVTGTSSGASASITSVSETGIITGGATTAWGDGTWGSSVWGGSESLYSNVTDPTTWTFCTWGEDLIGNPRGGKIYILDTSAWEGDSTTNMTLMSANAPSDALGIFMNSDNRTLVAYGAHDGSASDPLNIAWCDEEDYTTWAAASDNTAGSLRCEIGSRIIGRMPARGGHLISTDAAIYLFRYIGLPFVFSLDKIADGASMIGPHSSAELDGITYWMNKDSFYFYDGTVQPLPCDLHGYVFGRLNAVQANKVYCGTLRAYNEIWWFYVSSDDTEIDSYIAYNTVERTWHKGSKARTSWLDTGTTISYPVGAEEDGTVNAEEYGTSDNGADISYSLKTNDIEIDDGSIFLHNRMLIPDYKRITGTHSITLNSRGWPSRAVRTKGPFDVTSATEKISVRSRGRTIQFEFSGSDDFRLGRWRYRITGHGRRP
jgi:hypothetical protein